MDHCEQAEAVQSVIHAEAEKRRKERENFHITSVPVLVRAAHEPSLYNGSSEDHEEGTAWSFNPVTGQGIFTLLNLIDQMLSVEFFSKSSKKFWR